MRTPMWLPLIASTLACVALSASVSPTSTSSFLSKADITRLKKVVEPGFELKDLATLHYAVIGYNLVGETIPKNAEACKFILSSVGDASGLSLENLYYAVTAWKGIGICQPLPNAAIIKTFAAVVEKESSTIPEVFYAVTGLSAVSQHLTEPAIVKLVKALQAALKKDDSILNLGYLFHIAAELGPAGSFAFERIEDAIVQADEVDGKYLQFEGGLSITSLVVKGAFQLSTNLKKKPPITSEQTVKFANYLLSRRSVQTSKGVVGLLAALSVLANNPFENPICIALADGGISVSSKQPLVSVKVCDILGRSLKTLPSVVANSATRVSDDVVVISKKAFQPLASDKTLYTMNLMEIKPERGVYKISVSAGSVSNIVTVKVLSEVVVDYLEIGTADADQTTQPKLSRVEYPKKLSSKIEADSQQKLVIRFLLKDSTSQKPIRVHQAFVRLYSVSNSGNTQGQEIIFVAEPDTGNVYKFDMDVGSTAGEFGHISGDYNIELIVGDAVLINSFQWNVAQITLKLPESQSAVQTSDEKSNLYKPKPEIKHMFREPEVRPSRVVSNLFTGLCLAPVLLLLILWAKLGVNISNFPLSLSAIIFHLGLGGIFALFGVFWLQLNMFVTLRYLLGIGVVTFLAGNKLLSQIASRKGR
ncbi:dolichyl-diphosphooligosaccharide--protein glycosyltransferase subunit 2 [Neodiprion fabricii]|uniref:dolichyl-diphosphooligosaccharide--protein glycosyltransferase subunit 2 n=1 Tax=Neodiprion fabricii TaxID=2872261 RepID=UPI001ED8CEEF|nr:dolichyl-diphosphooligosaccharide--protein glycosyltransferase subunit 2 [Neodiprion fabricii]